ncbi:MAG TPA: hypothetical protein VFY62_16655 [Pseudomonas sp.]|nr:hypothetical protein [Pseudomonas sp.]
MPTQRSHTRQAGLLSNLLAIGLLTLPIPTQASTQADQQPRAVASAEKCRGTVSFDG